MKYNPLTSVRVIPKYKELYRELFDSYSRYKFKSLSVMKFTRIDESKKFKSWVILLLLITCFACQTRYDVPQTIEMDTNWQFKQVTDSVWRSATVPGNVFSDLLEHQLIEDPFIGNNEVKVQWVSEADWEYKTTFNLGEETLEKKHLELNFEGLDTYASVYLNDSLILKSNNAFRGFEVDVKSILKSNNELRVLFEATSKYEEKAKSQLPYELPEGNRIFTRKAQFQYGWDWGPKLNTSGVWRPIKLIAWNDFRVKGLGVKHGHLSDSLANLYLDFNLFKNEKWEVDKDLDFEIYVNDSLYQIDNHKSMEHGRLASLQIKKPKLWWPHNLGEPYLYDFKFVIKDGNIVLDTMSLKKGLRTVELVNEKDSLGESFYFKINDVPVYAKGANYIPQHSFQNKVTDDHYERLLTDVVDANMNMLRVWGGGIYENGKFYELCDEKGIMVWQDFMFACAMYPGDDEFLKNAMDEAVENVKRLNNYASIVLWCGNNESSEGWHRWGWQANRSEEEKARIWKDYEMLFQRYLRLAVGSLSPYWESSPKYGRGNPQYQFEGDAHDWWVWHDGYPFEHFEAQVPRFMSEFGFQAFPSYETIQYINQNDSIIIDSEGFKNHQKHHRGFQLIREYMERDFPVPDKAEDYVYMSQLVQAKGITKGIEAHRRAKPYNMGTLYWQLNDCWPAVSWSSIDYFGNWKALHYKAKQSFENILVSNTIDNDDDIIEVFVINDGMDAVENNLELEIRTFNGDSIWSINKDFKSEPLSNTRAYRIDFSGTKFQKDKAVLVTKFNGQTRYDYFVKPKDLSLEQEPIEQSVVKTDKGFQIELISTTLQKEVFLYTDSKGQFLNNFFDLMPNEKKVIQFISKNEDFPMIKLKSLNNFIR